MAVDPEEIVGELRDLPGAAQHVGRDHVRDVDLPVAVLARVHVEHELDQGPMQAREPAAQGHEPAPRQLPRELEVERAEPDPEVGVVLRLEVEARRLADPPFLAVVVLVPAHGHGVVGEVGDLQGDALDLRLELRQSRVSVGLQLVAEPCHVREQRLDVLAFRPWPARSPSIGCCARAAAPGCVSWTSLRSSSSRAMRAVSSAIPRCGQPGRGRLEITPEKCWIEHGMVFAAGVLERPGSSQFSQVSESGFPREGTRLRRV